jgi:hypothetical protein
VRGTVTGRKSFYIPFEVIHLVKVLQVGGSATVDAIHYALKLVQQAELSTMVRHFTPEWWVFCSGLIQ